MHCIKQNADQLYRVRRGNDQPFTLVVRRSPEGYELGEGKGEQLSPEELHELSVTIYEPNFGKGFTPDIRTFGDALGFELSRKHTEHYGLGIYEVEVSFTIDGEYGRTLRAPLCLVVKEGAHFTAQNHQLVLDLAPIAKGDRGDRGQSAYEAYLDNTDDDPKMTEAEWVSSLKSAEAKLREAKEYTDVKVGELSTAASNARDSLRESLGEAIASGINTAVSIANGYADTKFGIAQGYADTVLTLAKGHSDTNLGLAKGYSDTNLGLSKGYADNGDAATLRGANNYTDTHVKRAREEAHQESELVRELAYRKSSRFLAALPPAEYKEGDEWVLTADWTTYKRGTALIAVKDSRAGIYSPEDWAELHKYVQLIEEAKRWNVHTHTFDLTQLDPSKYYAAVIHLTGSKGIPYKQPAYFEISLYAGLDPSVPKPPYATHPDGFGVDLRWSVNASGYGGRSEDRLVSGYSKVWVAQGEEVVSAPRQLTAMSAEYVYLRGGGRYIAEVKSDYKPTFALATESWALKGYERHVIPSPVDSIMPPKTDIKKEEDERNAGDVATLAGAKAYADGHLARGRSEVHDEVNILKTQIAGKMQHFIGAVVPTGYRKGDLWTLTADWTSFKSGVVLIAGADELTGRYTPSHWQELWGFRREAKEVLEALRLGGRNYLRAKWSLEREQDGSLYEVKLGYELPAGTYTLSGDMEVKRKGDGLMLIPTPHPEYFKDHQDEWARTRIFPEDGRIVLTFTTRRAFNGFFLYPNYNWLKPGTAGHVIWRRLKLERGNKPSDWSPAPEDTEEAIAELVRRVAALEGAKQA